MVIFDEYWKFRDSPEPQVMAVLLVHSMQGIRNGTKQSHDHDITNDMTQPQDEVHSKAAHKKNREYCGNTLYEDDKPGVSLKKKMQKGPVERRTEVNRTHAHF